MFSNYKSPLGYVADGKKIDTYGVDHSGFTTKDEIEYQMARQKRENSLIEGYNNQGITKDYPQYSTNFWGKADNNYGFGSSNIADNIKVAANQPLNISQHHDDLKDDSKYWETAADGEKVWNYVQQQEGNVTPKKQNPLSYGLSGLIGGAKVGYNYLKLRSKPYTDKYKHAYINCSAAQSGKGGYDVVTALSNFKEQQDISSGGNTIDSSSADNYANIIGRTLGTKYPDEDCDVLVQRYINKNW